MSVRHGAWMLAVGIAGGWGVARAQPIVTDRPDFTESAVTVPAGRTQLEAGASSAWAGGARELAVGELLLRIGLGAHLELRAGLNSLVWAREDEARANGREDGSVGVKLALRSAGEGAWRPDVALIVASSVPSGTGAWHSDDAQPEAKLCAAWTPAENLAIASNLNVAWASDADGRYAEPSASVSLARPLGARAGMYLEGFGFAPAGDRDRRVFLDGGVTWALGDEAQLDARAGVAVVTPDREGFVGLGISRRW